MIVEIRRVSITRNLVTLAAAVVVIVGMHWLASLLVPVLMAIFFVLAFLPMLAWLQRKGVSRLWATVIVILTVIVSALALVGLIVLSVAQVTGNIPEYRAAIRAELDALSARLADMGIIVSGDELESQLDFDMLLSIAVRVLPSVMSFVGATVLVVMLFIYALIDADGIRRRLRQGIGADDDQVDRLASMVSIVGKYISIRLILGGAAAILDIVLLLFVGVDYALFWGVFSLITSFIPYIGYWVALIPPCLIALATIGPEAALVVFIGYWLINGAIDNLVSPQLLGRGLGIAPVVTIISIVFWGSVLGPAGAILAMPLTIAVKLLLLDRYSDTRWLSLLMSTSDGRASNRVDQEV